MGFGAAPRKILVLDPMLGWADLPMVLCMIFEHGFGRNGFQSMVLDAFNTVGSQLVSVDIKILDEDKCINLLCSLLDSWDSLVIEIGSNATALQFDEIVSSLMSEEMRRKNMESQNGDALSVRGRSQNRNKNKSSSGRSKSLGKLIKVVC